MPGLSIIICTYNRSKYLVQVLESLAIQQPATGDYEIIVIDNNSTDNTEAICTNFRDSHNDIPFCYFKEKKQGLSHARNRGIAEAHGAILAFIDDDAIAGPEYIRNLMAFYRENPQVEATGGKIIPKFEGSEPNWLTPYLSPLLSIQNLGDKPIPYGRRKFPFGANMAFRKEVFLHYGTFDTDLGRKGESLAGAEEKDLLYRIKAAKKSIFYLPDAWVHHVIPEARLTRGFIRKLAVGIGYTAYIRSSKSSKIAYFYSIMNELFKWIVSLGLFLLYLTTLKPAKGNMLVYFRFYVTSGLVGKRLQ